MSQLSDASGSYPAFERVPLHLLPPAVAERIAAGEVIERPASVVKELLENALDAVAQEIRIEVRGGGLRLIRVSDDGHGIPETELAQVCIRHTTSKIQNFEDLEHLHTLGFRGEALASIATISELTILSRASETEMDELMQPALWITWRGGEQIQRGHRARPHGTTITVSDLFYNVPVRLGYSKAARTENGHIIQLVRRYAIGYPGIRFTLRIDEHNAVQTSGSGDLATALTELYHLSLSGLLHDILATDEQHYRIHGIIGNRVLAQNSRQYITLFVNGRLIQSRAIQDALERAYRPLLPKGKHPLLSLFIDVPPEEIDVNIHPAKTEIHFLHEGLLKEALTAALKAVLERVPASALAPDSIPFPGPIIGNQHRLPGPRRHGLHVAESAEGQYLESLAPASPAVIASLHPLAQLQQAVILAEAPDGSLYLIDQHRAHERAIYEHLRSTYSGISDVEAENNAHLLLEPVMIEMKRYEADLLEQRLPNLRSLGIDCERFGGRSFLVRSVPVSQGSEQLVAHLQELAEIAAEDSTEWEDQLLIGLACHSALRRGRELSIGEQRTLLKALSNASAPAVCPHGSPILLHYSRNFLVNKFDW
ncbi:DNA mismatch repair endonuclease MutL [Dictyobacter arantiisoli]|uniref:DNA mismatch repair protein MutL n=1 Tax=Dictyobacter arantiisoli TaxID=2014874 RepID=A0A5A5TBJ5_9CHLR|nr:DNA mismatch repair endonuclease MutL [Dictyobacter arantiisoli]GCF08860.1 DNA mismatch repair protein MutL [Dictyobacter arantiisoli]